MIVMVFNLEKKQNRFIKNVDSNRISTICGSLSKKNTKIKYFFQHSSFYINGN